MMICLVRNPRVDIMSPAVDGFLGITKTVDVRTYVSRTLNHEWNSEFIIR